MGDSVPSGSPARSRSLSRAEQVGARGGCWEAVKGLPLGLTGRRCGWCFVEKVHGVPETRGHMGSSKSWPALVRGLLPC